MSRYPYHTPRQEFQRTYGFTLYTDAGHEIIRTIQDVEVDALDNYPNAYVYDLTVDDTLDTSNVYRNPAGASLYIAMRHVAQAFPELHEEYLRREFVHAHGVTDEDLDRADKYTFHHGFDDLNFSYHIAAGVANAVIDAYMREGKMTPDQKARLTLHDWADVIDMPDFRRIMLLMAHTNGGVYASFGNSLNDYSEKALEQHLLGDEYVSETTYRIFEIRDVGAESVSIAMNKFALQGLRELMTRGFDGSIGCPVARTSVHLPIEQYDTDDHLHNLLEKGILNIASRDSDQVHVTQDTTVIDSMLQLFSDKLRQYEVQHGTPVLNIDDVRRIYVEHRSFESQPYV